MRYSLLWNTTSSLLQASDTETGKHAVPAQIRPNAGLASSFNVFYISNTAAVSDQALYRENTRSYNKKLSALAITLYLRETVIRSSYLIKLKLKLASTFSSFIWIIKTITKY